MPGSLTPAEATLRAKMAAHASWKNTDDPSARTANGRAAFEQRFLDEVDPDRTPARSRTQPPRRTGP